MLLLDILSTHANPEFKLACLIDSSLVANKEEVEEVPDFEPNARRENPAARFFKGGLTFGICTDQAWQGRRAAAVADEQARRQAGKCELVESRLMKSARKQSRYALRPPNRAARVSSDVTITLAMLLGGLATAAQRS